MALSDEAMTAIVRMARLRADRTAAYDQQLVVVQTERARLQALDLARDRAQIARDGLSAIVAGPVDEIAWTHSALSFAHELAPELVDALTAEVAAREAAMVSQPPPVDPQKAALDAAVEALLAGGP